MLMRKEDILALYDRELRENVTYPDTRRDPTSEVIRYINDKLQLGFVLYSCVTSENVDRVVDEQIAYFERIGMRFEWKVFEHDTPHDLKDRLAARGFEVDDDEAVMVLDVASAPDALLAPITHDIRKLTTVEEVADMAAIWAQVWPDRADNSGVDMIRHDIVQNLGYISVYVAYIDGVPASTARIDFPPGSQFGGLWGGSTVPAYRKYGLYTELLAVRVQEARARGVRFLNVDASSMSRPILEKFGFQRISTSYPCVWNTK
jgi:GNAT superfamily N-acetyltransferase